ncbi:hypothetical protein V8E36_009291, partial [Tilletia maclaganii]
MLPSSLSPTIFPLLLLSLIPPFPALRFSKVPSSLPPLYVLLINYHLLVESDTFLGPLLLTPLLSCFPSRLFWIKLNFFFSSSSISSTLTTTA